MVVASGLSGRSTCTRTSAIPKYVKQATAIVEKNIVVERDAFPTSGVGIVTVLGSRHQKLGPDSTPREMQHRHEVLVLAFPERDEPRRSSENAQLLGVGESPSWVLGGKLPRNQVIPGGRMQNWLQRSTLSSIQMPPETCWRGTTNEFCETEISTITVFLGMMKLGSSNAFTRNGAPKP